MNEIPTEQDYETVYNARVIVLADNKDANHNAALLWDFFGADYCSALAQLLLTFVQAERMKGQAKLTERFAELREEYGDDLQEMSDQYGAYL